jgi:hypothetical protein
MLRMLTLCQTSSWLFLAIMTTVGSLCVFADGPAPISCTECRTPGGKKIVAVGQFGMVSRNVLEYRVPDAKTIGRVNRLEPWVISLTLSNREGPPCSVELHSGPDDDVAKALIGAIKAWISRPLTLPSVGPVCFRTRLYVYVRQQNGHTAIIIPRLTDRKREQ